MPNPRKPARLWLRERSDGSPSTWYILGVGKPVATGCTALEIDAANEALKTYIAEHHKVDTRKRDLNAISCADVMSLYLDQIPPDSPSRATRLYHLKALEPFWASKMLGDVKGSTCRAYVAHRPVKPQTARLELKTLQVAINHWHKESPLVAVPKVTLPPPAPPKERFLERSEVARMLWACRKLKLPHVARFIIIGIYTGTRHNAILSLRWSKSLSGGYIDLQRRTLFRRGVHERETSKRKPPFSFGERLHSHFGRWYRYDEAMGVQTVIAYQGAKIKKMKRAWRSVCKEAGLGNDVTPHTLRHTFVTWELWKGRTIWEVAGDAGADASTIERVYGHHRRPNQERKTA